MNQEESLVNDQSAEGSPDGGAPTDSLKTLEAERDQLKAIAQRTQADFINYKRRMEEERSVLARNAANGIVTRLLPVLDDLHRAVDALPTDAPPTWSEGVRMIGQNLHSVLQSEGVEAYTPAPGEPFDPAAHEAVYYQPSTEQAAGSVLSTVRSGYRTRDRVLRPAQVVVARETEEA